MFLRARPFYYHHGGPYYRSWRHGPRHHSFRGSSCHNNNKGYQVSETEQGLYLSLDVPGIKMNDLNVEVEDGILHVSGKREGYPELSKYFRFDTDAVDVLRMEAKLQDGVLVLHAPKMTETTTEPRNIPIAEASPKDDSAEAMQEEEEIAVAPVEVEATVLGEETTASAPLEATTTTVEVTTVDMENEKDEEWEEVEEKTD